MAFLSVLDLQFIPIYWPIDRGISSLPGWEKHEAWVEDFVHDVVTE